MKKRIFFAFIFLMANIATVLADDPGDLPCGDADPDGVPCPIDTWVIGFAIIALVLTVLHLNNKSKQAQQQL